MKAPYLFLAGIIVPGAAHYPYLEQPQAFAEAIEDFVVSSPG